MKLKNKKTGEIGKLAEAEDYKGSFFRVETDDNNGEGRVYLYRDLKTFAEAWEDYEEPKKYWYIDEILNIWSTVQNKDDEVELYKIQGLKEVGNYFETGEEAELAIKKLKAWKRLKDNGFRFNGYTGFGLGEIKFEHDVMGETGLAQDLNLLFGGEE